MTRKVASRLSSSSLAQRLDPGSGLFRDGFRMLTLRRSRWWGMVALGLALSACGGDEEEAAVATGGNTAPTITGSPSTSVNQGAAYSFTPVAADADGDGLVFGIDAKPTWALFNTTNGLLSGTPTS